MKNKQLHFFAEESIISAIMPAIPTVWFSLIGVFTREMEWVKPDGKYSPAALAIIIVSIIMGIVSIVSAFLIWKGNQRHKLELEKKEKMIATISRGLKECDTTWQNLVVNFPNEVYESPEAIFSAYVGMVLRQLVNTVSGATHVDETDLVATLFYRRGPDEPTWTPINSDGVFKGLRSHTIFDNPKSVFAQILTKQSIVFYADKSLALKKELYLLDKRDECQKEYNKPYGSIFGNYFGLSLSKESKCSIELLIAVASYGKELCSDDDTGKKELLSSTIMEPFAQKCQFAAYELFLRQNTCNGEKESSTKEATPT